MRTVIDWLEHRTGVESAIKSFLYEDIPDSAGWHHCDINLRPAPGIARNPGDHCNLCYIHY